MAGKFDGSKELRCSFCGKSQEQVKKRSTKIEHLAKAPRAFLSPALLDDFDIDDL